MTGEFEMKYLIKANRRRAVRKVAREAYLTASRRFTSPPENKPEILGMTVAESRAALVRSGEFDGILGSIMLTIAMHLVVALVEKWLKDNLFSSESLSPLFKEGEPGYVAA